MVDQETSNKSPDDVEIPWLAILFAVLWGPSLYFLHGWQFWLVVAVLAFDIAVIVFSIAADWRLQYYRRKLKELERRG